MINRLCETTNNMAKEALSGKWGRELIPTPLVLTEEEFKEEDRYLKYAYAVKHIAEEAPIRILPTELVVGATTLQEAPFHQVPVRTPAGDIVYSSLSHCTLGFYFVLDIGYNGLREQVKERRERGCLDKEQMDFLKACDITLDAMETWHKRYMDLLEDLINGSEGEQKAHYIQVSENLKNVPANKPENFKQAVQSLWFMFAFQRHCGNWPGIGRIDLMLGDYLKKDLESGAITLDEAREYIAHFWIKGCEWIGESRVFDGSGDGQHYQNIILAGVDSDGNDVLNEVTYLVLDVVEELRICDFPIAVRISKRSPEKLLRRIAEVQRLGSGVVAVYNNDFIVKNLIDFGYPAQDARNFANDGCWEIQVPGMTCFSYHPFDSLTMLESALGLDKDETPDYPTFEDLYKAYDKNIQDFTTMLNQGADNFGKGGSPNTLFSLFTMDCIENAKGYYDRGARYYVLSPHAGGLPDVIDSLYCIKKIVYDDKKMTLRELTDCLRKNWEGSEELRQSILKDYEVYGNENEEADELGKRVLHDFARFSYEIRERNGVKRPAGISTFGREVQAKEVRKATAHGHKAGEILAANLTPTPGSDKYGPTALISSHCALDLSCLVNGTALDMKICPDSVKGEDGITAMVGLYKTFVDKGGIFMHIDVVDNETLIDAMEHPEKYPTLSVRVSGWSARFVTLKRDWQNLVLKKSMQTKR